MGDQEYNSGKKYRQKGTLCGPNKLVFEMLIDEGVLECDLPSQILSNLYR
jgi:hypothetical protein